MSAELTYQVENWSDVIEEIKPYFFAHWQEVGVSHTPPDPDYEHYKELEGQGSLHVVTVRDNKKLVGYLVTFVTRSLHYKETIYGAFDIYYLAPDYRKGTAGVKLFSEGEKFLKEAGVMRLFAGTKRHKDMGRIFEWLGWNEIERSFTKWIGD